jgi:AhpD family alkylhydroperoxidase
MIKNWPETASTLSTALRTLRTEAPDIMKAFTSCAQTALKGGALDLKTKELLALGISIAVRCDDCIAFHAKAAVEQGVSEAEVLETIGMAIYMGAGPSVMYASHALEAFSQFSERKTA